MHLIFFMKNEKGTCAKGEPELHMVKEEPSKPLVQPLSQYQLNQIEIYHEAATTLSNQFPIY